MADEGRNEQTSTPRSSTSWQLVVFLSTLVLVVILLLDRPQSLAQVPEIPDDFNSTVFLSGIHRRIDSQNFRRGEASAFMGGVEIDLTDAQMEGDEATLDVSSVMGGIQIRVPRSWTVVSRVDTVMGGFKDETHHPAERGKKLILEGSVLMGGVHVEN
jgi:predicted membrane protein